MLIVAAAAIVGSLAVWLVASNLNRTETSQPPISTSQAPASIGTAVPASATGIPEGCPADPKPIAEPVSMTLLGHNLELSMMTVGLVDQAAGAPPGNQGYTVGWFDQGPKVGSDEGKIVLTSHTFQFGGAFGNDLNNGLLKPGDVFKITGADGSAACYRYASTLHLLTDDYDPDSKILYDHHGDPQFALVVCSDYTASGESLGRMIYYADLITATVPQPQTQQTQAQPDQTQQADAPATGAAITPISTTNR